METDWTRLAMQDESSRLCNHRMKVPTNEEGGSKLRRGVAHKHIQPPKHPARTPGESKPHRSRRRGEHAFAVVIHRVSVVREGLV